jgi:hypothetical protein
MIVWIEPDAVLFAAGPEVSRHIAVFDERSPCYPLTKLLKCRRDDECKASLEVDDVIVVNFDLNLSLVSSIV